MRRQGLSLLLLLMFIGYVLQEPFLITSSVAILVIIGIAKWWQKKSLDGVVYRRRFYFTRGFPGEHIQLKIEAENRKLLPISWLRVQDDWQNADGPEDEPPGQILALLG